MSTELREPETRAGTGGKSSIIQTRALTKVYPTGLKAVDGLDLEVREGEIFGLLGPNGAGKTTTVGMLTTRVIPTSGTATIGGIDVVAHPTVAKQLIGVVSQQNTLDRSVSVWENLYFHGRYFGLGARAAKKAADESLEKFRLTDRASADVATLSGGMAQRLMVARSILHNPPMLFLDEPTAGLDPQSRLALWEILGELHKEGQTILLTTHYMEEADQLCDRLAVMDHGRLLALDTPEDLKRSVEADTEIRVTTDGDLEALAKHLESFEGAITSRVLDDLVQVTVKGSRGVLPRIVDHAEKGGFAITDLSINEPTLETVFIELTGKDLRE
ncbi:MAG: type transport system ATP-binding protein [Actinomycetota bacterium]|jgi:ABC-2 type transport system ATP-binding protein|nr:type transport system ATP-binding protein [Actinomycetota bacterium]MEA2487609.1 type transport system ATP-binding protein [Actinomycetota bacterium]